MPGRVIDLVTKVGEHVKAGQKLLVTEAMKLETVIKAPDRRASCARSSPAPARAWRPAICWSSSKREPRREAVSFRRAGRGEARACCCPTARASTPRASAATGTSASSRAATASARLARWVATDAAQGAARAGRRAPGVGGRPPVEAGLHRPQLPRPRARERRRAARRADRLPEGDQRAGRARGRSAAAASAARRPTGRSSWRW